MQRIIWLAIALLSILSLLVACAPVAPTATPTKPAVTPAAPPPGAATAPPAAVATKPAAAPGGASPAATTAPVAKVKRGGTLVQGAISTATSLDPLFDSLGGTQRVGQYYEALLRYEVVDWQSGKSELKPVLAESWERVDPKTVVFKLRKGVKFHDGSDFTAEGAKWSLDRMATHPKSLAKSMGANFASIDVVDPNTMRINFKSPSAVQLINLTADTGGTTGPGPFIVSKAQMDKVGEEAYGSNPSGTGPMKFVAYDRNSEIRTSKFDGYWGKGADGLPLPYLDGVRTRIMVDVAVHITELRAGTMHLTNGLGSGELASVKVIPDVGVMMQSWAPYRHYFSFNSQFEKTKNNLKLRQAFQYGLDREQMSKTLGMEAGMPSFYMGWVPSWPGYDETLPRYNYDLDKAKSLLTEAGYPGGFDVQLMHYTETPRRRMAEMAQAMWGKVGLRLTLDPADQAAAKPRILSSTFEMNMAGMASSPDPAYADRILMCNGSAAGNNYCNPEVDKCMIEGANEIDPNKRAESYKRCQRIIYEDAQLGGLYLAAGYIAHLKQVKGVVLAGAYHDLREAWLDK